MSGFSAATSSFARSFTKAWRTPLSYTSTGSSDASTPSAASSASARSKGATLGTGCVIRPNTIRPDSSRSSSTGTIPHAGLERDHAQLERRAEHERGAEARMPGEGNLVARREDAQPHRAALARRQHEDGLAGSELSVLRCVSRGRGGGNGLGEPELVRQLLHGDLVEVPWRR